MQRFTLAMLLALTTACATKEETGKVAAIPFLAGGSEITPVNAPPKLIENFDLKGKTLLVESYLCKQDGENLSVDAAHKLSQRRASSTEAWLVSKGISAKDIRTFASQTIRGCKAVIRPQTTDNPAPQKLYDDTQKLYVESMKSRDACTAYMKDADKIYVPPVQVSEAIAPYPSKEITLKMARLLKNNPGTPDALRTLQTRMVSDEKSFRRADPSWFVNVVVQANPCSTFGTLTHLRTLTISLDHHAFSKAEDKEIKEAIMGYLKREASGPSTYIHMGVLASTLSKSIALSKKFGLDPALKKEINTASTRILNELKAVRERNKAISTEAYVVNDRTGEEELVPEKTDALITELVREAKDAATMARNLSKLIAKVSAKALR